MYWRFVKGKGCLVIEGVWNLQEPLLSQSHPSMHHRAGSYPVQNALKSDNSQVPIPPPDISTKFYE